MKLEYFVGYRFETGSIFAGFNNAEDARSWKFKHGALNYRIFNSKGQELNN